MWVQNVLSTVRLKSLFICNPRIKTDYVPTYKPDNYTPKLPIPFI